MSDQPYTRDELAVIAETRLLDYRTRRLLATLADIEAALDEAGAPTESGGIELGLAGRVRALRSVLVIEANRLRGTEPTRQSSRSET
jgi:hypothetical protein